MAEKVDRAPVEFGSLAQRARRDGRCDVEQEDLGARTLQDLYLRVERGRIRKIERGVGDDHPRPIAEPLLQSLEQISSELIALPEHGDLALRIRGLDVLHIYAPLGPKGRLPTHGPGKRLGISELVVSGCDVE